MYFSRQNLAPSSGLESLWIDRDDSIDIGPTPTEYIQNDLVCFV